MTLPIRPAGITGLYFATCPISEHDFTTTGTEVYVRAAVAMHEHEVHCDGPECDVAVVPEVWRCEECAALGLPDGSTTGGAE